MGKQLGLFVPAAPTLDERVAALRGDEMRRRAQTKPSKHHRSRAVTCPNCGAQVTIPVS